MELILFNYLNNINYMTKEQKLSELYYDVENGFGSAKSLYDDARKAGLVITLNEVKEWLRSQTLKQRKGYTNSNSYSTPFARAVYSMDIMDMTSLMKDTGTYKKEYLRYGLVCIDNFSKKCHVVAINNKDGETLYDAFMECFKVMGQPQSVYSDDEGGFKYKKLQEFFKAEGIIHNITLTHANVAERMIRTLKKMISDRLQIHKGSWTLMLKPVLEKYNSKMKHGTTEMTPNEAHKDENSIEVKANSVMKEKYLRNYPNIKEGDKVRILDKGKGNYTSRKESRSNWSEKVYEVKEVNRDMQLNKYYVLEGLTKRYMRHELLLVNK